MTNLVKFYIFAKKKDMEPEKENKSLPETPIIYQSWSLTKVKYSFTKIEKHIFLKVIDIAQKYVKKEMLGKRCSVEMITEGSHTYPEITFPIKDLVKNNSCNYKHICESIESLGGKSFGLPIDSKSKWDFDQVFMFQRVRASKEKGLARIEMTDAFWKAFLNMEVYKMLDSNVVYRFNSVFTSRMYDFLVGTQRGKVLVYKIKNLQGLFCLENTYTPSQFIKRVIDVAQKEMKEMDLCPFYFEYEITKNGRSLDNIQFNVIYKAGFYDEDQSVIVEPENKAETIEVLDKSIIGVVNLLFDEDLENSSITPKLIKAQNLIGEKALKKEIAKIWNKIEAMEESGTKCNSLAYLSRSLDNIAKDALKSGDNNVEVIENKKDSKKSEKANDSEILDYSYFEKKARLSGISVEECLRMSNAEEIEERKYRITDK